MNNELMQKGELAKQASYNLIKTSTLVKNNALKAIGDALIENTDIILKANEIDVKTAIEKGISSAMVDRLTLTKERILGIAEGVYQVISLDDPIGETVRMWKRPNGLEIGQRRVPLGVIAIIYESRPNVTVDAAVLCLKTSNAVVLRGGSEAIHSNKALMSVMQEAAYQVGLPVGSLNLIEDTSRETAKQLMQLNSYIDVLIPRGGAGLIRSVVENATVPVIETAAGNCHIYVDGECDISMALDILINAKVSRPSVCNAAETLLVDESIADIFLPLAFERLIEQDVEIRACERSYQILSSDKITLATQEDWETEYNDYILAVKVVNGVDGAIRHINQYSTKHSEAIITTNYNHSQQFLSEIDSAAVYVNASTRFTDGFEFGFGAEIGISTQKMHARGPMGLEQLTTIKYVIYGDGQIRV